mgnify:CR=1 FL=1|jgi:predicted DNA-binding antitoxin AbrB/MazE fold protein
MPKVIEVIYENGVFKPLEKVDLREKTKLKIAISEIGKKEIIKSYRGIFGRAEVEDLEELEEEAQIQ